MNVVWRLRQGADKRIRSGHPWVFSNELSASPKGHTPGGPVELHDAKGQFLARGYGNPHSLIAFRALSFDPQESEPTSYEVLHKKILSAWELRKSLGFLGSFRLCFGESDYLPGLVLDYYVIQAGQKKYQVFAAQIVTAGLQVALHDIPKFFEGLTTMAQQQGLSDFSWADTAVVIRNDVGVRKLEGIEVEKPRTIKSIEGVDLSQADIILNSVDGNGTVLMRCDLAEGQKTGFFLDQTQNIFLAVNLFLKWAAHQKVKKIRVLDLCCYVGHWSTQIAHCLSKLGIEVSVDQVDVSESALTYARGNAERAGAVVKTLEMDVTTGLGDLAPQSYDIVIADPPAFIKSKKDLPTGKHAYMKMNAQAFRLAKKGGFVVSCSCSGLLPEEDFRDAIRKGSLRNSHEVRGVLRGGHAADHPTLMQFPEGFYLKMYTHQIG